MSNYVNNHPEEFQTPNDVIDEMANQELVSDEEQREQWQFEFRAQIVCMNTGETIATISSQTSDGLEEEMGKSKWSSAIEDYLNEQEYHEER